MPLLDAEVAGQTTASTHRLERRASLIEQGTICCVAHHGVMVAMRLCQHCDPLQRWW
jgi:hypothetical protein